MTVVHTIALGQHKCQHKCWCATTLFHGTKLASNFFFFIRCYFKRFLEQPRKTCIFVRMSMWLTFTRYTLNSVLSSFYLNFCLHELFVYRDYLRTCQSTHSNEQMEKCLNFNEQTHITNKQKCSQKINAKTKIKHYIFFVVAWFASRRSICRSFVCLLPFFCASFFFFFFRFNLWFVWMALLLMRLFPLYLYKYLTENVQSKSHFIPMCAITIDIERNAIMYLIIHNSNEIKCVVPFISLVVLLDIVRTLANDIDKALVTQSHSDTLIIQ